MKIKTSRSVLPVLAGIAAIAVSGLLPLPARAQKKPSKPPVAPARKPAAPAPVPPAAKKPLPSADAGSGAIRLVPPTAHNNKLFVDEVLFTPDGRYIVTHAPDRALGVWEVATGRLVRRLASATQIERMKMTPDGRSLIAIDRTGLFTVWDLPRAQAVRVFDPYPGTAGLGDRPSEIKQIEMHPQGKYLALWYNHGTGNNSLFLIDPVAGKRALPKMREFLNPDYFAFTADGKSLYVEEAFAGKFLVDLATGSAVKATTRPPVPAPPPPKYRYEGKLFEAQPLKIIEVASGKMVTTFEPMKSAVTPVIGFLPDPRYALFRQNDDVVVWDLVENVSVNRVKGLGYDPYGENTVRFSESGTLAAFLSPRQGGNFNADSTCQVRDMTTGDVLLSITEKQPLQTTVFSADGKLLAIGSITEKQGGGFEGHVAVWDIAEKKKVATLSTEMPSSLLFLPGNDRLVVGGDNGSIAVYDWASGDRLMGRGLGDNGGRWVSNLLLSPLGADRILYTLSDGTLVDFSLKQRSIIKTFVGGGDFEGTRLALSEDKTRLAYGSSDGGIKIFDLRGSKPPIALDGHIDGITALRFTSDNKRLVSASDDGTTCIWNLATGSEVSRYVLLRAPGAKETDLPGWLAYNRAGNFEGSEKASRSVHFAKGLETFAVDQFFDQFYRRGLTRSSFSDAPPQTVASLDDALKSGTPPTVRIMPLASGASSPTAEVVVEATEQGGGGVKAIRLYHNDRLVGGPAALRGIAVEAVSGQTTTKKFTVPLASGENTFRAVAYSKTDLESRPDSVTLAYQPAQVRKPTLYVLSVGINKYKDSTMNLSYAKPDADAIADFFGKTPNGTALFGRIQVARLIDEQATADAILNGIAAVGKESTADDVVFVYLAGHGETAEGVWHFLPAEMRQMALPERVKELGIAWPRVEEAIAKITARKVVLVVDACKSGAALGGRTRGTDDSQQTLAVMARAQGIHILTASTSQQYAGEVQALGHGILTYALLEGLGGKATGLTSSVTVLDLMSYVETRVPALSKQYRGEEQYPVPFGRGNNFPVAVRQ